MPNLHLSQPKVVLVFGGPGFIGTHLIEELVAGDENTKVICADLRLPRELALKVIYRNCDVRKAINLDVQDLSKVYNLAAVHTTPAMRTTNTTRRTYSAPSTSPTLQQLTMSR
jgi:GlcNAc-P-P-Und epimerase